MAAEERAVRYAPSGAANGGAPCEPRLTGCVTWAPIAWAAAVACTRAESWATWFSIASSCCRSFCPIVFGKVVAR